MGLRKGKEEKLRVEAVRKVRQAQGAAYDPTDPAVIARNKRRAEELRNTPAARAARGE